jgi:hypothetical protein
MPAVCLPRPGSRLPANFTDTLPLLQVSAQPISAYLKPSFQPVEICPTAKPSKGLVVGLLAKLASSALGNQMPSAPIGPRHRNKSTICIPQSQTGCDTVQCYFGGRRFDAGLGADSRRAAPWKSWDDGSPLSSFFRRRDK